MVFSILQTSSKPFQPPWNRATLTNRYVSGAKVVNCDGRTNQTFTQQGQHLKWYPIPLYQFDTLTATAATPFISVLEVSGELWPPIFSNIQHSYIFLYAVIQNTAVFRAFFFQGVIVCLTAVSCIVERLRAITERFKSLLHISMKREEQRHKI